MDATQGTVLGLLIVAVVAVVLFFRSKRSSVEISGGGVNLKAKGSNDPLPGAVIEGSKSRSGGATAEDELGRGATIRDTEVEGELRAINRDPGKPDPKA